MGTGYGGETPFLLTPESAVTLQAPGGTSSSAPVEIGDLLKIEATEDQEGTGYRASEAAAGDTPSNSFLGVALVRADREDADISVLLLDGAHRITRVRYDTAAPTLGQSIEVGTNVRRATGKVFAKGDGLVTKILEASGEVEVLF